MWWKVFDLVPGFVWAAIVAVLLLVTGVSYVRMVHAKGELAEYRTVVAENTRQAEVAARAKEQAMRNQVDRIANNAAKNETILAARVATTQLIAGQLRDDIERLNAGPTPTDPQSAALAGEARTARELLGSCTKEYRVVAEEVDRRGDQITGLLDWVNSVARQK